MLKIRKVSVGNGSRFEIIAEILRKLRAHISAPSLV